MQSFFCIQRLVLAFLLLGSLSSRSAIQLPMAVVRAQPQDESYQLPLSTFVAKLIVVDDDIDADEYIAFFTSAVQSHLEAFMAQNIPDNGNIVNGRLSRINLQSDVKRTFLGTDAQVNLPVSMFKIDFTGDAVLNFATSDDRLVTQVRRSRATDDIRTGLELTLHGDDFDRLLQRIAANNILAITVKVQIMVEDGVVLDEGTVAEAIVPEEDDDRMSLLAMASLVIFVVMVVTLACLYFLVRYQRKQAAKEQPKEAAAKRKWKRTAEREKARREEKLKREESLKKENPDQWMDQMAEKMTSIPVRDPLQQKKNSFRKKKPQPRPALAGKRSSSSDLLFCINESSEDFIAEGDEEQHDDEEQDEEDAEWGHTAMQFADVDLASPEDYEPRIVNDSIYL